MPAAPVTEPPTWRVPRRVTDSRVLAGVAGGIARELGLDAGTARIAFVVLGIAGGWGVGLYLLAWVVMVAVEPSPDVPVSVGAPKGRSQAQRLLGFAMVVLGLLLLGRSAGVLFVGSVVWPLSLFGAGVAVARERGLDVPFSPERLVGADRDRSGFLVRAAIGGILIVAGVVLAVSLNFDLRMARDTLVVVGVVVVGLGLVLAPWVVALVEDLGEERRARIRSDERARVAAHLHDSVLQTLSLIQRRAADTEVVALARRQERELRSWLYGRGDDLAGGTMRAALEEAVTEIEELHRVPVELVVVGDGALDESHVALLAATREAVTNAARHSGADRVDVFAEIGPQRTDVYVRDTGVGFDPAEVPPDRRGLADSVRGRLERIGGTVVVTTAPGAGTEVELSVGGS